MPEKKYKSRQDSRGVEKPSRYLLDLNTFLETDDDDSEELIRELTADQFHDNGSGRLKKFEWRRLAVYPFISGIYIIAKSTVQYFFKISFKVGEWAVRLLSVIFQAAVGMPSAAGKFFPTRAVRPRSFPAGYDEARAVFNMKLPSYKANTDYQPIIKTKKQEYTKVVSIHNPSRQRPFKFDPRSLLPDLRVVKLRSSLSFAVILMLLILPIKALSYLSFFQDFKGRILGVSEIAAGQFQSAAMLAANSEWQKADANFESARLNFLNAEKQIKGFNEIISVLAAVIPNQKFKMAAQSDLILEAGQAGALLGKEMTAIFALVSAEGNLSLKDIFTGVKPHMERMKELSAILKEKADKISADDLPAEYRGQIKQIKDLSSLADGSIKELNELFSISWSILGFDRDKRYLLVFQNNSELRASGGFIGSYAIVDFRDGQIQKFIAPGGGSYDTEAGLLKKIIAPAPLHLVNPLWHFWDANWWPDWPTSARKLMWFLEESDGPTVDGVISLTPTVAEQMLASIGPINMQNEYGAIISAENFWEVVQEISEQKPEITNKPKKIIGDLIDKILNEIPGRLNRDTMMAVTSNLLDNLKEKQILLYCSDKELQARLTAFGWGGELKDAGGDYLAVINTNIAGGKSDRKIKEEISHDVEIDPNGSIIDTVRIVRTHTAAKNEKFTGVRNVNWLRIYVPAGSTLLSARGFSEPGKWYFSEPEKEWTEDPDVAESEREALTDPASGTKIYGEAGKTVFANWSMIDPGEKAEITVKYKLPFTVAAGSDGTLPEKWMPRLSNAGAGTGAYGLLVQKQPGSIASNYALNVEYSGNYDPIWIYPAGLARSETGLEVSGDLKTDRFYNILFEIK